MTYFLFIKLGKPFNNLLIRLVCAMIWLNPSVHFSDLLSSTSENEPSAFIKPKLNSHVLAAFKFVESTRISVVRRQQQYQQQIQQQTTSQSNEKPVVSLFETMYARADYLLSIERLSESILINETLIKPRMSSSSILDQQSDVNLTKQQSLNSKSKAPLPKCSSHPLYSLVFEFVFDDLDRSDLANELNILNRLLDLKRNNAELLCENIDLLRSHVENDLVKEAGEDHFDVRQNLETLLVLLSSFFSTKSGGQFRESAEARKSASSQFQNLQSSTKKTTKPNIDLTVLFPPSLQFKPNYYMDSFFACGLDIEHRLRQAYYDLVKCLLNYSKSLRYFS